MLEYKVLRMPLLTVRRARLPKSNLKRPIYECTHLSRVAQNNAPLPFLRRNDLGDETTHSGLDGRAPLEKSGVT